VLDAKQERRSETRSLSVTPEVRLPWWAPPGCGKTAIAEGLAGRIAAGRVPAMLRDSRAQVGPVVVVLLQRRHAPMQAEPQDSPDIAVKRLQGLGDGQMACAIRPGLDADASANRCTIA
jgi:hypothetical protein